MNSPFTIATRDPASKARLGQVVTRHGAFTTPAFMPVGTQGAVKTLSPQELNDAGAEIILSNTYHLFLRPGEQLIKQLGGLHRFMGWERPILTDSGGFQVFSLADLSKKGRDGVTFQSHWDGAQHFISPEKAVEIQNDLGVDIMMCFDVCAPYPADYAQADEAQRWTTDWARRCQARLKEINGPALLFGIVQGGVHADLRRASTEALMALDFPGYAIGGLSVGEPRAEMYRMLEVVLPLLPADKPRYLMGLGTPEDLVECVGLGVDMFDCVIPTRNGRNGTLYTPTGKLIIKAAACKDDPRPIDENCPCYACRTFPRAYIRHLFASGEMLGPRLATLHNIYFFMWLVRQMRAAIAAGNYPAWKTGFLREYLTERKII